MKKSLSLIVSLAILPTVLFSDIVRFGGAPTEGSHFSRRTTYPDIPEVPPSAGIVPFAFSIIPPAQFPPTDWDVYGLRVNAFVGHHRDVAFIDVGFLGNIADGNLSGIEIGGLYNRIGSSDGAIQIGGLLNYVQREFCGFQASFLVNRVEGDMEGLQVAAVNMTQDGAGIQIGVLNRAERFSGLQIGLANYAYQLQGVQIGVFNVIEDSNIPFMPVLNVAF